MVVGITGASGVIYGVRLLQLLRGADVETHLVMSRSAQVTLAHETSLKVADFTALADAACPAADIAAAISSGSFRTMGMVVAPCSMRSLSEIAFGTTTTLLTRAADVVLKERRRLVLMARETPLHLGHLRSMVAAINGGRNGGGRCRLSASACVLRQAARHRRPYARPRARPVRHRRRNRHAVGREAIVAVGSQSSALVLSLDLA